MKFTNYLLSFIPFLLTLSCVNGGSIEEYAQEQCGSTSEVANCSYNCGDQQWEQGTEGLSCTYDTGGEIANGFCGTQNDGSEAWGCVVGTKACTPCGARAWSNGDCCGKGIVVDSTSDNPTCYCATGEESCLGDRDCGVTPSGGRGTCDRGTGKCSYKG